MKRGRGLNLYGWRALTWKLGRLRIVRTGLLILPENLGIWAI
jgi:hypothetical protein